LSYNPENGWTNSVISKKGEQRTDVMEEGVLQSMDGPRDISRGVEEPVTRLSNSISDELKATLSEENLKAIERADRISFGWILLGVFFFPIALIASLVSLKQGSGRLKSVGIAALIVILLWAISFSAMRS